MTISYLGLHRPEYQTVHPSRLSHDPKLIPSAREISDPMVPNQEVVNHTRFEFPLCRGIKVAVLFRFALRISGKIKVWIMVQL